MHNAANEALEQTEKTIRRKNDAWWNDSLNYLVNEKKIAYLKWFTTQYPEDRKIYRRYNYKGRKEKKKAINKFWEKKKRKL